MFLSILIFIFIDDRKFVYNVNIACLCNYFDFLVII